MIAWVGCHFRKDYNVGQSFRIDRIGMLDRRRILLKMKTQDRTGMWEMGGQDGRTGGHESRQHRIDRMRMLQ